MVHTEAVDVDADGQVDLLTLSREDEVERCHSMMVHWVHPHTGGPVIGEASLSLRDFSSQLGILHSDKSELIAEHILSPPLVLE